MGFSLTYKQQHVKLLAAEGITDRNAHEETVLNCAKPLHHLIFNIISYLLLAILRNNSWLRHVYFYKIHIYVNFYLISHLITHIIVFKINKGLFYYLRSFSLGLILPKSYFFQIILKVLK